MWVWLRKIFSQVNAQVEKNLNLSNDYEFRSKSLINKIFATITKIYFSEGFWCAEVESEIRKILLASVFEISTTVIKKKKTFYNGNISRTEANRIFQVSDSTSVPQKPSEKYILVIVAKKKKILVDQCCLWAKDLFHLKISRVIKEISEIFNEFLKEGSSSSLFVMNYLLWQKPCWPVFLFYWKLLTNKVFT